MYVHDTSTCICNGNGTWPHRACGDIFDALPTEEVATAKCDPDGYVFVDCNVCRCDAKGKVDTDRCTKNECDATTYPKRRTSEPSNLFGNCEAKNWYSMAPCQFCFCINENKLVCNTGTYVNQHLQLGTYNLSMCGKDLIREAIELIPDNNKTLRERETSVNRDSKSKRAKSKRSKKKTKISFPSVTVDRNNNVVIAVNGEFSTKLSDNKINREYSKKAHTESEEEKIEETTTASVDNLEQEDDYKIDSEELKKISAEYKDMGQEGNSNNDVPNSGLKIPVSPKDHDFSTASPPFNRLEELGRKISENLPMVLSEAFNMALRRKSVSIEKNSECLPGAVNVIKCNTCVCLKNNKMLCTNNLCE